MIITVKCEKCGQSSGPFTAPVLPPPGVWLGMYTCVRCGWQKPLRELVDA